MIGLPVELPADKARGYSSSAAESWMKQVALERLLVFPPASQGADAAVLWGGFQGPGRKGDYALRLINEGGAWKVDSFALTSASFNGSAGSGGGADGEYQRFAARAFGGLLCDKSGMPKDSRVLALAACLTPALRAKLAEPFGSDKDQGFDYNRGKLLLEAEKMGGGGVLRDNPTGRYIRFPARCDQNGRREGRLPSEIRSGPDARSVARREHRAAINAIHRIPTTLPAETAT